MVGALKEVIEVFPVECLGVANGHFSVIIGTEDLLKENRPVFGRKGD